MRCFSPRWSFSFSRNVGSARAPSRDGKAPPCVRCSNPWSCRISRSLRIVTCEVSNCRARSPTRTRPSRFSDSRMARLRSSLSTLATPNLPHQSPAQLFLSIAFYNVFFRLSRTDLRLRYASRKQEPSAGPVRCLVPVRFPPEVSSGGFMNCSGHAGKVRRNVMFEAVFANVVQQLLHFRNLHNPSPSEGIEWDIGEAAFANVAAHSSRGVISRKPRKAHSLRLDQANDCAVGVLLPDRAGNDFLKIHFEGAKEMFRKIRAVEANRFIRVGAVIVVPVKQRGRRSRSELQGMHAEHAGNVHLARAR